MSEKIIRNPEKNCEVLVSQKEEKYRKKHFPDFEDIVKSKSLKCTVCSINVSSFILSGKSCYLHLFLKVLVCKKCMDFYGSGEFSTDEDGDEKYCRWCGQGGKLFLCDKCNGGFCKACVKRNFSRDTFQELNKKDAWDCFICDPEPLFDLRAQAWSAEKYYLKERKIDKRQTKSKAVEEEEEEAESNEDKVVHVPSKKSSKTPSLNSREKFIEVARKWFDQSLKDSIKLSEACCDQTEKLRKKKITRSTIKKHDDVLKYERKIQSYYDSIIDNIQVLKTSLSKDLTQWQEMYSKKFNEESNAHMNGKSNEEAEENAEDESEKTVGTKEEEGEKQNEETKKSEARKESGDEKEGDSCSNLDEDIKGIVSKVEEGMNEEGEEEEEEEEEKVFHKSKETENDEVEDEDSKKEDEQNGVDNSGKAKKSGDTANSTVDSALLDSESNDSDSNTKKSAKRKSVLEEKSAIVESDLESDSEEARNNKKNEKSKKVNNGSESEEGYEADKELGRSSTGSYKRKKTDTTDSDDDGSDVEQKRKKMAKSD